MYRSRWWLSLGYLIATLVAQAPHDHHRASHDAPAESRDDCDDLGRHVASHEPADHANAPDPCPACQVRVDSILTRFAPAVAPGPGPVAHPDPARPRTEPGAPLRPSCRAPPSPSRV